MDLVQASGSPGQNPLLISTVLKGIFAYFGPQECLRSFRLVCRAWNEEVMRYYYRKTTKALRIESMDGLQAGLEILENKSVDPLLTRFEFLPEVDPASPLFLDFLLAAGESIEELQIFFRPDPPAVSVLRRVLQEFPALERLDIFWSMSRRARLFDLPPVLPNLRHITFRITPDSNYELFRELLESAPNLRTFACTNYNEQIGGLARWLLQTLVLDPTFPRLTFLEEFNWPRRLRLTELELVGLTERQFPLNRLHIDVSGPISREVLDGLFAGLSGTLRKLRVTFSKGNWESLQLLSRLQELEVTGFGVPLEFIAGHLPELKVLELRGFSPDSLFPSPPKPRATPHGLKTLTLAQPDRVVPELVLQFAREVFPGAKPVSPEPEDSTPNCLYLK